MTHHTNEIEQFFYKIQPKCKGRKDRHHLSSYRGYNESARIDEVADDQNLHHEGVGHARARLISRNEQNSDEETHMHDRVTHCGFNALHLVKHFHNSFKIKIRISLTATKHLQNQN